MKLILEGVVRSQSSPPRGRCAHSTCRRLAGQRIAGSRAPGGRLTDCLLPAFARPPTASAACAWSAAPPQRRRARRCVARIARPRLVARPRWGAGPINLQQRPASSAKTYKTHGKTIFGGYLRGTWASTPQVPDRRLFPPYQGDDFGAGFLGSCTVSKKENYLFFFFEKVQEPKNPAPNSAP